MKPYERLYVWLAKVAPGLLSWPRVAAAVVIAAAAWIAWAPTLRTMFAPPFSAVWEVTEDFNDGYVRPPQRVDVTGFKACTNGWCLDPGQSGTLVYHFTAAHEIHTAMLWNNQPPGGTNRVSISLDGGNRYRTLTENSTYAAQRLDLGGGTAGGQALILKFEASNPSPNQVLAIDQLVLDSRGPWVHDLPRAVMWMIVSFGMAAVVLCRRWPIALSTVLILALAASFRYETALGLLSAPLDPDAWWYRRFAGEMRLFSETGFFSARFSFREPGYILVLHLFTKLFGSTDFLVRLATVILSVASVWAIMRVVRAMWGETAGQLAGLLVAFNVPLIRESVRGLRLELEILLCMAFFGLAFLRNWTRWPSATLAMAIAGAALVTTRATYVPIVLVLGTYAVYRRAGLKAAVGGALILAAVVAAGVVPHRYNLYKLHGDPYWDTTQYARWNANMEFAGRPGYPSLEEVQQKSLEGPRITYNEFMFGLHTPREIFEGTYRGYWKLYRNMEARPFGLANMTARSIINVLFQVLAAAGALIALWKREYRWIPFAFLVFEFPVAFLYDRQLVEIYRHSYTAFPLVVFAAVLTVVTLVRRGHGPAVRSVPAAEKAVNSPARDRYRQARTAHWDDIARQSDRGRGWGAYYHDRLAAVYATLVAPGQRVLELGCGRGDLLAAMKPAYGLGIDLSSEMVARATRDHAGLEFRQGDVHDLAELRDPFDVIIVSDLINDLWDVQTVFQEVRRLSTPRTRVILNFYSRLWELPLGAAGALKLARPTLHQNWLTKDDTANLLFLADLEIVRSWEEVLWPVGTPLVSGFANRYLAKLWPLKHLALSNFVLARPQAERRVARSRVTPAGATPAAPTVTVVVPARNEAGNIANAFARTPVMGGGTELIFVEGNSTDDTFATIEREIAAHPEWDSRVFKQTGKGKGDAVRLGYAHAKGDILMILDADLTMPPEDLPRFYEALVSGKAEFANGVRLVYPQEKEAMRFFNLIGNKFFSLAFSWLLGQPIKDTLCGTKVMWREDYERVAANRAYFGDFDPFGDFDLLFGAAKLGLKIVDVPIRYRERTYGETNIHRWSHGLLLLRMVVFAARRVKFI